MNDKILKLGLTIFSSILITLSFPTMVGSYLLQDFGWLAWFGLIPLFWVLRSVNPRSAFFYSLLYCLICYSFSIWWIFRALNSFGGISIPVSIVLTFLLVVIISLFIAVSVYIAVSISKARGGQLILWLSASWTAFEFLRHVFPFGGFPWAHLAMSQSRLLWVIQIADIVGIYGIIFLIVWVNFFIVEAIAKFSGETIPSFRIKGSITILLVISTLLYGYFRSDQYSNKWSDPGINVGMIQGNIEQDKKWMDEYVQENIKLYSSEADRLSKIPVDLIIWPEASYPRPFKLPFFAIDPGLIGVTPEISSPLPYSLIGALSIGEDFRFRNSALLFDSQGLVRGTFHKSHLVPFGEYIPMRKLFFFADKITTYPADDMAPGETFEPFALDGHWLSVLICYEDIFPDISRKMANLGSEMLVNLTNDAWYGISSAPYQHLALSVFRAVETRRFLLRATNTGVSAVVSPSGTIVSESRIFEKAVMVNRVPFLRGQTIYAKIGDWFAFALSAYVIWGVVVVAYRKIRRKNEQRFTDKI